MSARGLEIEYTDIDMATAWPLKPWAELTPTGESEAGSGFDPQDRTTAAARKSRDRGASAVEWVVITAIVVAIVTGVGVLISNAVKDKAKSACTQIVSTDTGPGASSSSCS